MILWRAELKRRGVAPPAPTVPRKGSTSGATGGAHAAATGGALGWCPVCTSSATEAFAPPKGATPSHGTTGAAAAQGCHAAPRHRWRPAVCTSSATERCAAAAARGAFWRQLRPCAAVSSSFSRSRWPRTKEPLPLQERFLA